MKHIIRFETRLRTPLARAMIALLVAFTLLPACPLNASAEINAQIVGIPARESDHWRITTFSGEMPEVIADALSKKGFSGYSCYSGAMIERMVMQVYRGDTANLNALALVAIEKEGRRTLIGLVRYEKEWSLCDLGESALLPEREFTISASDLFNDSVWYIPLRFYITYPSADGGSEIYGLYVNLGQTGVVPLLDGGHHLWYVNDYTKTDADGQGILIMNAGGAFRVLNLPYDPAEGEGYYPAYLPFTLDHMDSILDYPTNRDDAQRLAEASWARFADTDLALAWGGVNLRQYPTTASKSLGKIRSGALVHVLGEENGWDAPWYHVRLGQLEGFISGVYVKLPMTDGFASDLSIAPLTVAKSLDALTLRETPETDAPGAAFPANTLMHVLVDVDDDWLYVMVPNGDIGWEMDIGGTSGYVRASEVVQGVCVAEGEKTDAAQAVSPTTGMLYPIGRGDAYRPVLAVLSNSEEARPAYGLSLADIVYEYIYWGPGFTRYIALYNDDHPEMVSAIRSARTESLSIRNSWDCPIIFQGREVYMESTASLDASVVTAEHFIELHHISTDMLVDGIRVANHEIFSRLATRVSPHNVAANVKQLVQRHWPGSTDKTPYTPALPLLHFSSTPSPGDASVTDISIPYDAQSHIARYTYDATDGQYLRWYDGAPQVDALNDQRIIADNVLVLYAALTYPNNVMSHPQWDLTGEGKLDIFINGQHISGAWQRADDASPFAYFDQNGGPLLLKPGKTFIQIVPDDMEITMNEN